MVYTMYYIGIDLGGTNIAAGIVNENYEIIKKGSTPTNASADRCADDITADIAALFRSRSYHGRHRLHRYRYSRYC